MDNIRIAVLSAYDDIRAFLDNEAPDAMHYYNDELHEYLKGAASTYTFKTDAQHPESVSLVEGNKLSFKWRKKDYYFNIVRVVRDEYEVEVEAYSLNLELLNERVDAYKAPRAMKFLEYLDVFDFEKVLTLNINEVADKTITHEWTGSETVLGRIYSLATVFDAEAEFIPQLNNDYSLKRIVLNVYKKNSDTDQGMGRDRTDMMLRYGKEVSGITKTSDITELYTAIRPTGKDGLMVTNLDKTERDAKGNIEYQSPKGDGCIRAVQARDRFPSNNVGTDRYSTVDWSYDTDNVNTLYGQALAELKKNCVPQVQYEVEGYFDTDIGDTVTIVDDVYNPPLYLQARVTEQSRSFTDSAQNKTIFDNFKELQSQIDSALMRAMQKLIAENKVYTCSILTDNGIVFKNGEGSTTLTASVMDGGTDKTDQMTIQWYKDGEAAGSGATIQVNAVDINGKSVYMFEATDSAGVIRGTYEVTVTNVNDGTDGKPGPTGPQGPQGATGPQGPAGPQGNPTGITVSATEPSSKYTGMLWKHTGSVSGLTKDVTYRWTGTKWETYLFAATNIKAESLSSLSADLGTVTAGNIKIPWTVPIGGNRRYEGNTILSKSQGGQNPLMFLWDVIETSTTSPTDTVISKGNYARFDYGGMTLYDGSKVYNVDKNFVDTLEQLNRNLEAVVMPYTLKRCTYSSGNVYTQAGKLIINLTVRINTTVNSYDAIVEGLPAIRANMAVLNFFNATKGTQVTSAICQNGTVQLIGTMPSVNDAIAITGECLIRQ